MKIGYIRTSIIEQDIDSYKKQLNEFGCNKIIEGVSQSFDSNKVLLDEIIDNLNSGDTLVVSKIEQIGRSLKEILGVLKLIQFKKAGIVVLNSDIKSINSGIEEFIKIISMFIDCDNSFRKEKQTEGILEAKKKGVYKGRKPLSSLVVKKIYNLRKKGFSIRLIAKKLNISTVSVNKHSQVVDSEKSKD